MTPPLYDWLGLSIAITTWLKGARGEEQREKFCVDSIRRSVFLVQICRLFELLTRFIHKMTLLVVMFAVAGCVYMLDSVFILNVEVFI